MSLPTQTLEIVQTVGKWNQLQGACFSLNNCLASCLNACNEMVADINFATILSPAQQTWVQQTQAFLTNAISQTPVQPQG